MSDIPLLLIQRVCLEWNPPLQMCLSSCWIAHLILGRPQQKTCKFEASEYGSKCLQKIDPPPKSGSLGDDFNLKKYEILAFVAKGKSSTRWDGQKKYWKHLDLQSQPGLAGPELFQPNAVSPFINAKRLNGCVARVLPRTQILCGRCTRFGFFRMPSHQVHA